MVEVRKFPLLPAYVQAQTCDDENHPLGPLQLENYHG